MIVTGIFLRLGWIFRERGSVPAGNPKGAWRKLGVTSFVGRNGMCFDNVMSESCGSVLKA